MQPRALPDSGSWRLHPLKLPAANLIVWCGGDVCGGGGAHDQLERTPWSEPPARPPWRLYVYKRSGLPYLIVSGVWRNFQFLHICVTFDKFSALNPGLTACLPPNFVPYHSTVLAVAPAPSD